MEHDPDTHAPFSAASVELLFRTGAVVLALWTVLAQIALLVGLSFAALSNLFTGLLALAALVALTARARRRRQAPPPPRPSFDLAPTTGLYLLALVGAVIALVAIRPNLDDVGYVSRPLFFLEHPRAALDLDFHDQALAEYSTEYPLMLASTVELLWAYLARTTGLGYLTVYHQVLPFLAGFLLPLASFALLFAFVRKSPCALLGTAAIVAYLLLDGTTTRSVGNTAFVRIWQGKILLMSIFVPYYASRVLEWFERPTATRWIDLFTLNVCAAGLSGTSMVYLPFLALFLGVGALAAGGLRRQTWMRLTGFYASLAYSMSLAVFLWIRTRKEDYTLIGFEKFPGTFRGQFEMVFGEGLSLPFWILLLTTVSALVLTRASKRRFLAGWAVAALVLALNPIAMPAVTKLTTNNTYWRLFSAYPFPLVIGLTFAALPVSGKLSLSATIALLAGALGVNAARPSWTPLGPLDLAWGQNKIEPQLEREVREILGSSLEGAMIAPQEISTLVPMLSSKVPQVCVRPWLLLHFGIQGGQQELAESRRNAWMFLSGMRPTGYQDFVALLSLELPNVVLYSWMGQNPRMKRALESHGYSLTLSRPKCLLYTREGS